MKSKLNILICIYEIIGGFFGVITAIYFIFKLINSENYKLIDLIIYIFVLALYLATFIGGILLFKGKEKGIIISMIVQAFQIPYVITASCIYCIILGLQIGVSIAIIQPSTIRAVLMCNYGCISQIYFLNNVNYIQIGINIIPILIILYLKRIHRIIKGN